MEHLINQIEDKSIDDAVNELCKAHDFLVIQAKIAIQKAETNNSLWGIESKRAMVNLNVSNVPALIGKPKERLVEVINIVATVERLIAALKWFKNKHPSYSIKECHPSTSHFENGNDVVLVNERNEIVVRCEVCDVVSKNAGTNGKEKSDICKLGCDREVPNDEIKRYICTSLEFAEALTSVRRKWTGMSYRYENPFVVIEQSTCLLLIQGNR